MATRVADITIECHDAVIARYPEASAQAAITTDAAVTAGATIVAAIASFTGTA